MNLLEQIKTSLLFFVFGYIFYFVYKLLLKIKKYKVLLFSIILFLFSTILYISLYIINNGILSFYHLIFFLFGIFMCKVINFNWKKD